MSEVKIGGIALSLSNFCEPNRLPPRGLRGIASAECVVRDFDNSGLVTNQQRLFGVPALSRSD